MIIGNMTPRDFLRDYWQKKPLLIRQALADFRDPISPEELAGLACEQEVDSRLVFTRKQGWDLRSGPFEERDFVRLPEKDWTLLVQGVDQWFPKVRQLLALASFIPAWRVDDIMVSFAEAGGGVGPHFDYYDVFIVQGMGRRRWQLGQRCDGSTPLDTSSGMKILLDFEPTESFDLEPGDVLYIPPGVAHHGVSHDASLSYSIGFRAPSHAEMVVGFGDFLSDRLHQDQRYSDPDLRPATSPGEIPTAVGDYLRTSLLSLLDDPATLLQWFGSHMTQAAMPELICAPEQGADPDTLSTLLRDGVRLMRHPAARFAWTCQDDSLLCFAAGDCITLPHPSPALAALVEMLGNPHQALSLDDFVEDESCLRLISRLHDQGLLIDEDEDEGEEEGGDY